MMGTKISSIEEKETGSIEQGSENAEYEGGVSSVLAPFCFEEALVQRE